MKTQSTLIKIAPKTYREWGKHETTYGFTMFEDDGWDRFKLIVETEDDYSGELEY